ncbi:MAG: AI-2E family transporter, partial [Candidatus Omnitrophica bacterium]|nr:AI-2E family transporter [Candidatus Omnitrophota bacterium]
MKIEIDFGSNGDKNLPYRWFLYAAPLAVLFLVLFFWWRPILETLSPFALAFVFAYLLNPLIDFLAGENRAKYRMHRGFALGILFLLLLLLFVGVLGFLIPMVADESTDFAKRMRDEVF